MGYTPANNPYIPGDPYSYDLKWVIQQIKAWKDPEASAAEAKASAEAAEAAAETATDAAQQLAGAIYYITPQMFGAVGDGVTDDTDAFRSAISDGRPIIVPGGTYKLSGRLTITDNTVMIGFDRPILKWDNILNWKFGNQSINNVIIQGIVFDFATQSALDYGISLIQCTNLYFIDCEFTGGYGYATRFNESSNLHFTRCNFHDINGATGNPGGGIYGLDMHEVYVNGCTFKTLDDHGIYLAGTVDLSDVFIDNCLFDSTGQNGLTNGAAITLYAACHDVHISNCNISNSRSGLYFGIYGSYADVPKDVEVNGVIISNSTIDGILLMGTSAYIIERINIANTTIKTMGQDGISMRYTSDCHITNSSILSVTRNGIDVTGSSNAIVSNCKINTSGVSSQPLIVGRQAASDNNIFSNIHISGTGNQPVYMKSGANNIFTNIIEDTTLFSVPSSYGGTDNSFLYAQLAQRSILFNSAAPTAGGHWKGDICFNSNAASGQPKGWICTATGNPGTWVSLGNL